MRVGIGPKGGQKRPGLRRGRQFKITVCPKLLKVRQGKTPFARPFAGEIIQVAQPAGFVPSFGKPFPKTEALGQVCKNIMIVPRRADRLYRLFIGHDKAVAGRADHIVAFERGRGREDDIRVARHGRPPRLMDDNGFRLLPGPEQAVQVLMMMEDVAADPVDQANIRVGCPASIIVEFRVRIQQQVGNPGNRNDILNRVGTAVQGGPGNTRGRVSDRSDGRVAIAKPSAGETDLSQHGG